MLSSAQGASAAASSLLSQFATWASTWPSRGSRAVHTSKRAPCHGAQSVPARPAPGDLQATLGSWRSPGRAHRSRFWSSGADCPSRRRIRLEHPHICGRRTCRTSRPAGSGPRGGGTRLPAAPACACRRHCECSRSRRRPPACRASCNTSPNGRGRAVGRCGCCHWRSRTPYLVY